MDGTLVILVGEAKNLPNIRKLEKQSPFCCLRFNKQDKKSEVVIRGGQRPQWNFEAHYEGVDEDTNPTLKISVFDKTKKESRLICDTEINCSPVFEKRHKFDGWHDLSYANRRAGKVYIEMTFYPRYVRPQVMNSPVSMTACSFHESRPLPKIPNTSDPDETVNEPNNIDPLAEKTLEVDRTHHLISSQNKFRSSLNSFCSCMSSSSNSCHDFYICPEMHENGFVDNEHYDADMLQKAKINSHQNLDCYGGPDIDVLESAKNSLLRCESVPEFESSSVSQNLRFDQSNSKIKQDDVMIRAFNDLSISQGYNKKQNNEKSNESSNLPERAVEVPRSPFNPYKSTFSHPDNASKVSIIEDFKKPTNEEQDETDLMRISAMLPLLPEFAASSQNEKLRSSMISSVSSTDKGDSIFSTSIQSSLSSLPLRSLNYRSIDSPERFYPKFFLSSNSPTREATNTDTDPISFQESISLLQFNRKNIPDPVNDINIQSQESLLNKNYRPEEQKRRKEEVQANEKEFKFNACPVNINETQEFKVPYVLDTLQNGLETDVPQMQTNNPYTDLLFINNNQKSLDAVQSRNVEDRTFGNEKEGLSDDDYDYDNNNWEILDNHSSLESSYSNNGTLKDGPYTIYKSETSENFLSSNDFQHRNKIYNAQFSDVIPNETQHGDETHNKNNDYWQSTRDYEAFIHNTKFTDFSNEQQPINIADNFAISTSMFYKRKEPCVTEKLEPFRSQKSFFADLEPKPLINLKAHTAPIKSFNKKRLSKINNC